MRTNNVAGTHLPLAYRKAAAKLYPGVGMRGALSVNPSRIPIRIFSAHNTLWHTSRDVEGKVEGVWVVVGAFVPASEAAKAVLMGDQYNPSGEDSYLLDSERADE